MTTFVRIIIDGLWLYVPQPNRNRLTILAPAAALTGTHPHRASFTYRDPDTGEIVPPIPFSGTYTLPVGSTNGTAVASIPKRIHNITEKHTSTKVPGEVLDGNISISVAARLHINAGEWVETSWPLRFKCNNEIVEMSHRLIWEIEQPETTFQLPTGQTLHAVDGVIEFFVSFVPHGEEPSDDVPTSVGAKADHFAMLFPLFDQGAGKEVIPVYVSGFKEYLQWLSFRRKVGSFVDKGGNTVSSLVSAKGGDPVTCVGGGGGS